MGNLVRQRARIGRGNRNVFLFRLVVEQAEAELREVAEDRRPDAHLLRSRFDELEDRWWQIIEVLRVRWLRAGTLRRDDAPPDPLVRPRVEVRRRRGRQMPYVLQSAR